jgi:predicted acylesterase/phospholipase RssA
MKSSSEGSTVDKDVSTQMDFNFSPYIPGRMPMRAKSSLQRIRVQVVLQGGGAKLPLLMAVCEVLKAHDRIEITKVAGSSAGAIAAVMLCFDHPMSAFKADLKKIGADCLKKIKTLPLKGWYNVWKGKPYFGRLVLEDFFIDLFYAVKVSGHRPPKRVRLLSDLSPVPSLYCTNLFTLTASAQGSNEGIPKALAKSCGFPFALVGFKSGDTDVDGGLGLNFPVDDLKREEAVNGPVIGISFLPSFGRTGKSNLLSYAQQLFSAAIQSGVARSEAILGKENIFSIESEIGAFDFDWALSDGLSIHYDLVKEQFATWLEDWLRSYHEGQPRDMHSHRFYRPALSNIKMSPAIIRELDERIRSQSFTHAQNAAMLQTAILDEAGTFSGKYRIKVATTFTITNPINIMQFDFQSKGPFQRASLGCAVSNSQGSSLQFSSDVQEITNLGDDLRTFRIYFLFNEVLKPEAPSQPFVAEYVYEADDTFPKLPNREFNVLTRWHGNADEMVMAVAFPRTSLKGQPHVTDLSTHSETELKDLGFKADGAVLVTSTALKVVDFLQQMGLDQRIEQYYLVGRCLRDVKQGQCFGFVIE